MLLFFVHVTLNPSLVQTCGMIPFTLISGTSPPAAIE